MPQEIALFSELTIEEILCYFGTVYHMNRDVIQKRIQHLIELLRLPKTDRKISELSGGQQRLVSIAVTMIHRPPLLILDEPTVGVDSLLRCQIWKYLDNISKYEGKQGFKS
jgi:ABC-type multidrug transport system ATPase subunit